MTKKTLADVSNLRIEAYSNHPEVYAVAEWLVDSYMATKQRVRERDQYLYTARKLLASLWLRDDDLFKFTTKADNYGTGRKQVWMSKKVKTLFMHLRDKGMVLVKAKGRAANLTKNGQGMNTVYCRTLAFKNLFKVLTPADIIPNPDLPRIELRNSEKELMEIPDPIAATEWFIQSTDTLRTHYDLLSNANIKAVDGSPVSPSKFFYVRKFKNDFQHGGRIYAAYENWSKASRLGTTFDGEPALSLDVSQLHPSLIMRLYNGTDSEPIGLLRGDLKDAYDMPFYEYWPRSVHKKLVNTLFNSVSEDAALRSIMTAHLQLKTDEFGSQKYECKTYKGKSKRTGVKLFKEDKKGAIQYLNYFKTIHPYYSKAICSGIGSELQKMDSDYVMSVISICNELGVPVLPVHDEFVFPESYISIMKIVLQRAFQSTFKDIGTIGTLDLTVSSPNSDEEQLSINLKV